MDTLRWEDYSDNRAVRAAYRDLKRLATKRAIDIHSLSLTPKTQKPFWYATDEAHHIFVDTNSKTIHHSLVHELLHGILMEEGYCFISGCFHQRVHPIMTNDLLHPEVFRRMESYGLDMEIYWARWHPEMANAVDDIRSDWIDPHAAYVHFARIYPWHLFRNLADPYLERIQDFAPVLAQAVAKGAAKSQAIGFGTASGHRRWLQVFKRDWLQFCEWRLPEGACTDKIVDAIRESMIVPLSQRSDAISERDIYENLSVYGLPPNDGR